MKLLKLKVFPITREPRNCIVDDEDYDRIVQALFKWSKWTLRYDTRIQGRINYNGKSRKVYLPRFIMNVLDLPEIYIDHIDRDKLNNQKSNLRIATPHQSSFNRERSRNSTGYKGVFEIRENIFRSAISYERKFIYLGAFTSSEDAARAYDKKAKELFGEFASLNFPSDK